MRAVMDHSGQTGEAPRLLWSLASCGFFVCALGTLLASAACSVDSEGPGCETEKCEDDAGRPNDTGRPNAPTSDGGGDASDDGSDGSGLLCKVGQFEFTCSQVDDCYACLQQECCASVEACATDDDCVTCIQTRNYNGCGSRITDLVNCSAIECSVCNGCY